MLFKFPLAALLYLSNETFKNQSEITIYEEWEDLLKITSVNVKYFFTVIELKSLLFMFIKSLILADFGLIVKCLKGVIIWLFLLDHTHYARWMSVFIKDLLNLPSMYENIYQCFAKGYFTVKKSKRKLCSIGIDQAHEHNMELIKIDCGHTGVFHNEHALLKWAVSGPIIGVILRDINSNLGDAKEGIFQLHHKDTNAFKKIILLKILAVIEVFKSIGNPFLETESSLNQIATKYTVDDKASNSLRIAKEIERE